MSEEAHAGEGAPPALERQLTAIFSTDVKGYSRLMGDDELATVHTITAYRAVLHSLIDQHHGRVVDSPGDNMLAEFASVVEAVPSAVAIQKELAARNAELPEQRRMLFRIGINVGDVLTEGGRLYGDGVNIAARLESLADPGGICISGTAREHLGNKLPFTYDYSGERAVKNIAKPVAVYKVQLETDASAPPPVSQTQSVPSRVEEKRTTRRWSLAALAVVGVLVVGAGMLVFRTFSPPLSPPSETEPPEQSSALPLPDKPSIAVLSFTNMSGDARQDYFSDGITDTLITDLSKIAGLFVIARHSVFTYKGQAVKVGAVSQELGVGYVVEGGVQRMGERVRVNVQLIDATTGGHVWAERYDRELTDLFALQDELVQQIVTTLNLQLTVREQGLLVGSRTDKVAAYDTLLRGLVSLGRITKEANAEARHLFETALALDPLYAEAYALLAQTYWLDWSFAWRPDRPQALERAVALAQQAVTLPDSLPRAHVVLGEVYMWTRRYDQAIAKAKRAIAIDPNYADGYATLGLILSYAERPAEALAMGKRALRLNPHEPFHYLERVAEFSGGSLPWN